MDENEGNMVVCRREATGALYLTTAPTCFRISGFLSRFLFVRLSRPGGCVYGRKEDTVPLLDLILAFDVILPSNDR